MPSHFTVGFEHSCLRAHTDAHTLPRQFGAGARLLSEPCVSSSHPLHTYPVSALVCHLLPALSSPALSFPSLLPTDIHSPKCYSLSEGIADVDRCHFSPNLSLENVVGLMSA